MFAKTCADCEHFQIDKARSEKLGEPLGICKNQIDHGYQIGNFDAQECDGFDEKR